MITDAIISGRLDHAIFFMDGNWWSVTSKTDPLALLNWEGVDAAAVSGDYNAFTGSTLTELVEELKVAILFERTLFLLLSLLDPDLAISSKLSCAAPVEALLDSAELKGKVWQRLLSAPLPLAVRAERKSTIAILAGFPVIAELLVDIFSSQPIIDEVAAAFTNIASNFPTQLSQDARAELTYDGTLAAIVGAVRSASLQGFNLQMLTLIQQERPTDSSSVVKPILTLLRSALQRVFFAQSAHQIRLPLLRASRDSTKSVTSQSGMDLEALIVSDDRRTRAPRVSSYEAKTRVDKQIAAIKKELFSGRIDVIERYINELTEFQLDNSEREHLVKSFCSLASASISANQLEMADRLSNAALHLGVSDPVVSTTRAEVLKSLGHFHASLSSYEEAKLLYPGTSHAWNGAADVLKELGRFEDSLSAYKIAQDKFPENPVCYNGYVSTLRRAGRLSDALKEAFQVAQRFHDDAVSRSTLANTLAANGRYEEALKQYRLSFEMDNNQFYTLIGYIRTLNALGRSKEGMQFLRERLTHDKDNVPLANLVSQQLRATGNIDGAISLNRSVLTAHPGYVPTRLNLAANLIIKGNYEEAASLLPVKNLRSETDWTGCRFYIVALVGQNRFEEADRAVDEALANCAWESQRSRFVGVKAYVAYRLGQSEAAMKVLQKDLYKADDTTRQSRILLMGTIERSAGHSPASTLFLKQLLTSKSKTLLEFKRRVLEEKANVFSVPPAVVTEFFLAA